MVLCQKIPVQLLLNMADGINDVSLVEFVLKERNYLDVLIKKDEFVNLDFEMTLMLMMNC